MNSVLDGLISFFIYVALLRHSVRFGYFVFTAIRDYIEERKEKNNWRNK